MARKGSAAHTIRPHPAPATTMPRRTDPAAAPTPMIISQAPRASSRDRGKRPVSSRGGGRCDVPHRSYDGGRCGPWLRGIVWSA